MIKESDIIYEQGKYWILKTDKAYWVMENTITHSQRRGIFGFTFLDRAKQHIEQLIKG
jgi:ABC-type amino acid transport system permease subunit